MKYIFKLNFFLAAFLMVLLLTCSKEGEYTLEDTPPLDFRSYYNGLEVTFVNASEDATDISWNFGDETSDVSGDSVVHEFAMTGNYVITMKGTDQGRSYTFHTVLRVDKPSVVSLTDDTFDDWNNVDYPDFQLDGQDKLLGGEVDYDANYIYFYVEYSSADAGGQADLGTAVMDLYMDVDNSAGTGYSSSIGAELLFEGNIPSEWFDFYGFTGASQGDWSWETVTRDKAIKLGHTEATGDIVRMEFGVSREAFGISKDAFAFRMDIYYGDWSAAVGSLEKDHDTRVVMMLNKV